MDKEVKIIPPKGYEIDEKNSTFECIKFKQIEPQLPTTWEEFCSTHPRKAGEALITLCADIQTLTINNVSRHPGCAKNLLPSKEYAEAMLALCQLIQLRNCYNDGWEPDWTIGQRKYCLMVSQNKITKRTLFAENKIMGFKTEELRDKFLENFRDLIEIAKPLL